MDEYLNQFKKCILDFNATLLSVLAKCRHKLIESNACGHKLIESNVSLNH